MVNPKSKSSTCNEDNVGVFENVVEKDGGQCVEYIRPDVHCSALILLDEVLHRITTINMIIMSDPGLQKGFILDTEVVEEGHRQRVENRSAGCCSSSSLRT